MAKSKVVKVNAREFYTHFGSPKKKLTSAIAFGTLHDEVKKFSRLGFNLISLQQNAWLRIFKGKFAPESWTGNYVRESFLYVPDQGIFLTKDSPIIDHMGDATEANRIGKEFHIAYAEAEALMKKSVRIPYELKEIPVREMTNSAVSVFAFGKATKTYAEFLLDAGIEKLPIRILPKGLVDAQSQPFVRQAILRCMDNWSGLIGGDADLHHPYGVRFVSSSYNGFVDDRDETYTSAQIVKALQAASLSGLEIPVLRALRQLSPLPANYGEDPFNWGSKEN